METVALTVHESEINKLKAENLELRERLMDMSTAGMAEQSADLNFQLKMARQLIASKAFPNMTPEQAFVILQAGKEMGMQPMESIKKLYIVNGAVGFHGSGMVSQLTSKGALIEYVNETENKVTARVYYEGNVYEETATDKDQILLKSKAMTFAKKNKLRYHAIRMILSFHLPHLAGSVSVWEQDDIEAAKDMQKPDYYDTIVEAIKGAKTLDELKEVHINNKSQITKSIDLLKVFGDRKKELSATA